MAFTWNPGNKTYSYTPKNDPRDRVQVEVGDPNDAAQVQPDIRIRRWDGEIASQIRLNYSVIPGNISYEIDGTNEIITWRKGQYTARFYHRSDIEEGALEFELVIPRRPAWNCLEFIVSNSANLVWLYQAPYANVDPDGSTWQAAPSGAIYRRPAKVNGSYAVYHRSKGVLNDADGPDYKAGKAFHVYRPHATDANGVETWGTLDFNEQTGILTMCLDATWLQNAEYPVTVDPTFGYTTIGGSDAYEVTNYTVGSRYQLTENASTITQVAARMWVAGSVGVKSGIYADSSNTPAARFAQQTTATTVGAEAWFTWSYATGAASAAYYWLVFNGASGYQIKYDTDAAYKKAYDSETYTAVFKDPFGPVEGYDDTVKISAYATYTAAAAGRTTKNTDIRPLGIAAGISRRVN